MQFSFALLIPIAVLFCYLLTITPFCRTAKLAVLLAVLPSGNILDQTLCYMAYYVNQITHHYYNKKRKTLSCDLNGFELQ